MHFRQPHWKKLVRGAIILNVCRFDCTIVARSIKVEAVNSSTNMVVATQTDRPRSVHNCCVFEFLFVASWLCLSKTFLLVGIRGLGRSLNPDHEV